MIPEPTGEALRWATAFMREPEAVRVIRLQKLGCLNRLYVKKLRFLYLFCENG